MLLDYFFSVTDNIKLAFINYIPQFGLPGFWSEYVPQIFEKIFDFNDYLPVWEALFTVVFCLSCTLVWKVVKIVLSFVVDMNA